MKRMLVTGAAGFIGSHLVDALLADGHHIIGVDNFDDFYDPKIKRRNLTQALRHSHFELIEADIRDAAAMNKALRGEPDVVVHLAARAGVRPSIEQPALYCDVNVRGTLVLLEECKRRPQCKYIFGSSSSVYGNSDRIPFQESDPCDRPVSPYAATKRAAELLCHTYHRLYGMDITCLRFFTVYGPRQRPDLAIHKFARLIVDGRPIPIYGNGTMTRDYTYIADIVDGIRCAIERCQGFQTYNLGGSQPISLTQLVLALENAIGRKAVIDRRPLQPGDVDRTFADINLAATKLGYRSKTNLAIGLSRFIDWLREDQPA